MSIFDKMKQGASDAARKAQQTIEIARFNSQKSSREKDMTRLYTEMGEAMFRAYLSGETVESEETVASCCEQLKALKQEIESIDDRIKAVKLEKSCSCGKVVAINVNFCPDCGMRFVEQESKPEMTMGEIRVICPECDTENDLMARYCTDCGLELGKPKSPSAAVASSEEALPEAVSSSFVGEGEEYTESERECEVKKDNDHQRERDKDKFAYEE